MHRTTAGGGEAQDDSVTVPVDEDTVDANHNGIMDMMEEAIKYHVFPYLPTSYLYLNFIARMPYRDSYDSDVGKLGQYWIDVSNSTYFNVEKQAGITFYHSGGWYDLFTRDTVMGFNNLGGKLLLGPNGHFGGGSGGLNTSTEYLRWYDYWLKGIDNNIMSEPPVYYFTVNAPAGTEWRFAPQFPLGEQQDVKYYLAAGPSGSNPVSVLDGGLSTVAPTSKNGQDSYKQNYDPVCTAMMGNCSYDQWSLTYTTDVLPQDLQVTGSPVVHLWAASTATDQDFFADLEDIDEKGAVAKVVATQGRLRASHRALANPPFNFMGLPWHRSYQEDIVPLTPNTPTELVFDILPTSHIFKAGHRVRLVVMVASKQALNYLRPDSTVTIYRNNVYESYVSLPIISKLNIFQGTAKIRTKNIRYEGPADLYASPTAIYINYEDNWLRWDTERSWEAGRTEHYRGNGDLGHLSVHIIDNAQISFDALAIGNGVYFKGEVKY
jgi:putative CocE/NonD family hydrolase